MTRILIILISFTVTNRCSRHILDVFYVIRGPTVYEGKVSIPFVEICTFVDLGPFFWNLFME